MPRFRAAYPPEFRWQMVELVRSGRTPEELSREFEPTAQSIANWVRQAERRAAHGELRLRLYEKGSQIFGQNIGTGLKLPADLIAYDFSSP
jgi:transposase-like protein